MIKPRFVIVVAGGKGERMNADIPKQFIEIHHKPILMHTIEAFFNFDSSIQIILVLPESQIDFWKHLCQKHSFTIAHTIAAGGSTRYHSVKNGLNFVPVAAVVAIHDGVRPLVNTHTLQRCFDAASVYDAAIPVIDLVESIRKVTDLENQSLDRSQYRLVQTPQVFDADLLKKAYEQNYSELFTDDASVVEELGSKIQLVAGNRENIKITTEIDLIVAEAFMNQRNIQ